MEDYYEILGVNRNASRDEIKKAYRRLAHKHHPDKGGNETQFKKINEAYQVLSHDAKRAQYDQFGSSFSGQHHAGGSPFGFDFQSADFSDIFSDLNLGDLFDFAFRRESRQKKAPRGDDIHLRIQIDLAETLAAQTKKINLEKYNVCERCRGGGGEPGSKDKECSACRGKGQVHQIKRTIFGSMTRYSFCPECQGFGRVPDSPCHVCHGQGRVKQRASVDISIPAGVDQGQVLKFSQQGQAGIRGQLSGDFYVEIAVRSHPVFQRQGDDLLAVLPISFSQATLGGLTIITGLSGKKIDVSLPKGTASGSIIKVKGEGIPHYGRFGRGDLFLETKINVPKKLTGDQERALKDLQKRGL